MMLDTRYGLTNMTIHLTDQVTQSFDQEYKPYITCLAHPNTNPLVFWELEQERYPTIFRMAMNYLLIQPFAVPCKQAFSSSILTDTKQRNQISPVLMEALQILKSSLKKERPNLKWWMTSQEEMLTNAECGNGTDDVLKVVADEEGESLRGHHVAIY